MLEKSYKALLIALAFASLFAIEWLTPIHSDDYRYYLLGISPASHYQWYMTWSGRIVADYASALILFTQSQFVYAFSTAFAALAFCYFIAKTPGKTLRWQKSDNILLPLVFCTYWIANPNLGQTTFWLVGAANYLWTNLFVAAWIFYLYRITVDNIKTINPLLMVLAFMAGCSNESVSPFVVLLAVVAIIYERVTAKSVAKNKILYALAALAGSCTLIFSPGNFVRAASKTYWYGKPLLERITIHLTERVHNHLALIWISYVVLLLLVLVILFNKEVKAKITRRTVLPAILTAVFGVGTVLIMFASPSYPDRVVNGTFMFFLLTIAFIAYAILMSGVRKAVICTAIITLLCAGTFAWSWTLMHKSYTHIALQEQVRMSIIENESAQGNREITIPDYYFIKMQNSGGQFGLFHDPEIYGQYFGVDNIYPETVDFDYSAIAHGEVIRVTNTVIAYSNAQGDLIIISPQPITQPVTVEVGQARRTLAAEKLKSAKINGEHWYYGHIPEGHVEKVSL